MLIACCNAAICMNLKTDFHQPSIVRVTANLGNSKEEQTGPQSQRGARGRGGGGTGIGAEEGAMESG